MLARLNALVKKKNTIQDLAFLNCLHYPVVPLLQFTEYSSTVLILVNCFSMSAVSLPF